MKSTEVEKPKEEIVREVDVELNEEQLEAVAGGKGIKDVLGWIMPTLAKSKT